MKNNSNSQINSVQNTDNQVVKYSLNDINSIRVTRANEYKAMNPVIKIGGATFGVNGDISFVSGLPKAGKSTITRYMIATALMKEKQENLDSIGIVSEYCKGKKIIYIDTEQNPIDTKKMINSILDIAGLETEPENFIALNLREFNHTENREYLQSLFHYYNDAYLWIIDGVTDFLPSANDEVAGNEIIRYLMKMSSVNDTCIVCLIHENGGSSNGKMRGHIGSEAARKCQGAISVSYEDDKKVHSIKSTYFRGSKKIDPIYWEFNDKGKPISCDAEKIESIKKIGDDKNLSKKNDLIELLENCYKNHKGQGLPIDTLKNQIGIYIKINPKNKGLKSDSIRTKRDRTFNDINELRLLRTDNENQNGTDRKVYYYDSSNLEIKF